MYDFDDGAVCLDYTDGLYRVIYHGKEIPGSPICNCYVAISRYTSYINEHLRQKAKSYILKQGYNAVMGCCVNLPCEMCRELLKGNTPENGCIYEE